MKNTLKQLISSCENFICINTCKFFLSLLLLGVSAMSVAQVGSFRGTISVKSYDLDNDYNNSVVAKIAAESWGKSLADFDTIYGEYYVCNDTLVEKISGIDKANYKLGVQYGDYALIYIRPDRRFIKIKNNRSSNFLLSDGSNNWTRYSRFRKNHGQDYNYFHERKGDQKFKLFANVIESKKYYNINYAGLFANLFHANGIFRKMIVYDGYTSVIREYVYQEDEDCNCSKFFDNLVVKDLTKENLDFLFVAKPSSDSVGIEAAISDASPFFFKGAMTYSRDTIRSLAEFEGSFVYVDLWASWCGPCRLEMPYLQKVKDHYYGANLKILSISLDEEKSWGAWVKSMNRLDMNWHNWIVPGGFYSAFSREYEVKAIPRYLILNPKGEVVFTDAPRPSNEKIYEIIDSLLEK